MRTQRQHVSVISDLVPTHSDEVTNVTRMDLARALQSLDVTAADDDVFAEDTIELPAGLSDEATLL